MNEPQDGSPPTASPARMPLWLIATGIVAFLIFSLSLGGLTWWLISRGNSRADTQSTSQSPSTDIDGATEPTVDIASDPTVLEPGFVSLFNGRDLDTWVGDSSIWSVQDGVIRGSSKRKLGSGNWTCLFWQGKELQDFELRF